MGKQGLKSPTDRVSIIDISGDTFVVDCEKVKHAEDVIVLLPDVVAPLRVPLVATKSYLEDVDGS